MRGWQPGGSSEAQKLLEAEAVSLVRVSRSLEDMQQAMVHLHARLASTAAAAPDRTPSAANPARGRHSSSSSPWYCFDLMVNGESAKYILESVV